MLAIIMCEGAYCPLSPRDPRQRLHALVKQTQARFILAHHLTKSNFNNEFIVLDMDHLLTNTDASCDIDLTRLSNNTATSENIAYIIFTSGSTGTPKAVSKMRLAIFDE